MNAFRNDSLNSIYLYSVYFLEMIECSNWEIQMAKNYLVALIRPSRPASQLVCTVICLWQTEKDNQTSNNVCLFDCCGLWDLIWIYDNGEKL